jgi:hypothetical protein
VRAVLRWFNEALPLLVGVLAFMWALGSLADGPLIVGRWQVLVVLLFGY